MAEAPRPPGSRYTPLNVEAILGASALHTTSASPVHATDDDTIRPTPVRTFTSTPFVYGKAPATQLPSTPAPDHASRATSPDRLEPWEQPSTYLFEGQTVTLDELVARSAQHHHIPDDIANWVKTVTREISRADISLVYNTLGKRMYRHKDAIVNNIGHFYDIEKQHEANLLAINTGFPQDLDSIRANIRRIDGKITVLKQADGFCKDEIRWQGNDMDTLNANFQVMVAAMTKLSSDNQALCAQVEQLEQRQFTSAPSASFTTNAPSALQAHPFMMGPPAPAPALAPAPAPLAAPAAPPLPSAQHTCVCVDSPPKFSGNDKKQTLKHWLRQVGVWMRFNMITSNKQRITTALMHLEEGALKYCNMFLQAASLGQPLGTWDTFVKFLETGYRDMAPAKCAQEQLEQHCSKKHESISKFAEDFRSLALKSKYLDVELIRRIDEQHNTQLCDVMIGMEVTQPGTLPVHWAQYLDYALNIEAHMRDLTGTTRTRNTTTATPLAKASDAMDVDAICKANQEKKPLNAEQRKWYDDSLCIKCGKHKPKYATLCPEPKYKGKYDLPKQQDKGKKAEVCTVNSQNTNSSDSQSTTVPVESTELRALRTQVAALQQQMTTARIEEVVNNDQDFQQTL
jgi:hypothetical protein